MKNYLFFLMIMVVRPGLSQNHNLFTFPDLDGQVISIWLASYQNKADATPETFLVAKHLWEATRQDIMQINLRHFDAESFIIQQDLLMYEMEAMIDDATYEDLSYLSYEFLSGFRDVRTYFTSDLYPIDALLSAFDVYAELHYAVDDPLLGLYEWLEFTGLFEDFKEQFQRYVVIADPGFDNERYVLFQLMAQRVRDCSAEFERSLSTAMQNEFVAPCDDTHDALIDLIGLYAMEPTALQ